MSIVTDDLDKMYRDAIAGIRERFYMEGPIYVKDVEPDDTVADWEDAEAAAFDTGVKQGLGEVNDLALSVGSSYAITTPDVWKYHKACAEEVAQHALAPWRCPWCNRRYQPNDIECVGCGAPV